MQLVCAWCGTVKTEEHSTEKGLSHGICSSCSKALLERTDFSAPPKRISGPIILIDEATNVVMANLAAEGLLPHQCSPEQALPGDYMQCQWASEPLGCGRTVHCQDCVVRAAVGRVFLTGEPLISHPAAVYNSDLEGETEIRFLVSAMKRQKMVVVRIEPVGYCLHNERPPLVHSILDYTRLVSKNGTLVVTSHRALKGAKYALWHTRIRAVAKSLKTDTVIFEPGAELRPRLRLVSNA